MGNYKKYTIILKSGARFGFSAKNVSHYISANGKLIRFEVIDRCPTSLNPVFIDISEIAALLEE